MHAPGSAEVKSGGQLIVIPPPGFVYNSISQTHTVLIFQGEVTGADSPQYEFIGTGSSIGAAQIAFVSGITTEYVGVTVIASQTPVAQAPRPSATASPKPCI